MKVFEPFEDDKNTMFGDSDEEYEILDAGYRAHGSLHEMELPMIIYNTNLEIDKFNELTHNKDLKIHCSIFHILVYVFLFLFYF